jgi:hemoglobin
MANNMQSVYDILGGEDPIRELVHAFYDKVEQDPVLRPMFPDDLEEGKYWQFLFLLQFFGGPTRYMEERGHPRLRMRHFPFPINQEARDHWLDHMLTSIDDVGIEEPARTIMRDYFIKSSTFLINQHPQDE